MDEPADPPPSDDPAGRELRRSQSAIIRVAACWSVWASTMLGDVKKLFLLRLGGSPFEVGVLETLVQVSPLGQLAGLGLLKRYGKTGLAARGRVVSLVPLAVLVALSAGGWVGRWAVVVGLVGYAVMNLAHAVGGTGWWPLIQDNIAEGEAGSFLARIRTRLRIVDIAVPLAVGAYLGKDPSGGRFLLPFLIAAASQIVGAAIILRARQKPPDQPELPLLLRLRLAGRSASIRRYLVFVVLHWFFLNLGTTQWAVMLSKYCRLPSWFVVGLTALSATGHLLGLRLWAWMVDRHGGRGVITLSNVGAALVGLGWLALPSRPEAIMVWAAAFYLLWGLIEGGLLMGRTTTMLASVPAVYQASGLSLAMIALAVAGALGSLVGGAVFQALTHWDLRLAGLDARVVFFAAAQGLMILAWLSSRKLIGHARQTPTRQVVAFLWQRMTERFRQA